MIDDIVARRFGPGHERPCRNPETITCAKWACQVDGACRHEPPSQADIDAAKNELPEIMASEEWKRRNPK